MTSHPPHPPHPLRLLDAVPAVVAGVAAAGILTEDGEIRIDPLSAIAPLLGDRPPLLVHAPASFQRLGLPPGPAYDLLELFAFARPARMAAPTPAGLAAALGLPAPGPALDQQALSLPRIAAALLAELAGVAPALAADRAALATWMGEAGWPWAPIVLAALAQPARDAAAPAIWKRLPEWEEVAPPAPPGQLEIRPSESRARLAQLLGEDAEPRPGQADYAAAATAAFAATTHRGAPHLVLAEAGTGTGKTLGYIAPASLWAERNQATVWISTYTRHLQRQIAEELFRLYPDPAERRRHAVLRKGRENYLCLLNYEERAAQARIVRSTRPLLGLIAAWALATEDGDLTGGDLPGWIGELAPPGALAELADRRGECIHGGCAHYRRCFVEHSVRRARGAQLVVANHALVMAQAAWGGLDDPAVPARYVFDEGHHLFEAADSAFAAELSGTEAALLRHWLLGAEGGRSRYRGLRRRMEDLLIARPALAEPLDALLAAARILPAGGWISRAEENPDGPAAHFLALCRRQVLARHRGPTGFALETDLHPILPELGAAAAILHAALRRLAAPIEALAKGLVAWLEDEAETLDSTMRQRIEALGRGLGRRATDLIAAWCAMLTEIATPPPPPGTVRTHLHLLFLDRIDGRDRDAGLRRHWLDPTLPFAASLGATAQGMLITSATLRDSGPDAEAAWEAAEARAGAPHFASIPVRASVQSPFDYAAQTRAFIVTDLGSEIGPLAHGFRALFQAAGGGALGLFTAIARLRAVHAYIGPALEAGGIRLLAQHVDGMHATSLIEIFRAEPDSCLLGTDAMRDGVDVPGRALRLVVFERVPWPRPDILHRERRIHLSGGDPKAYDDRIARLRLRQAFGRLIRSATDRGVFVLLDRRTPSRLLTAFPEGVTVQRLGLAETARQTTDFLATRPAAGHTE